MPANNTEIEKRLWDAADELRANSKLKSSEYSVPVLGLIFLRYADQKFTVAAEELEGTATGRRTIGKADYQARGVLYLPDEARFSSLLNLPEGADIGKAINDAMRAIEAENEELRDILPKTHNRLENSTLVTLLKLFSSVPMDIEGDAFGKIYEYFLGEFAMSEGRRGGEFYTPTPIVRLIVEVIEPYHGRIFDPACGSGGMFVQSARFVEKHRKSPSAEISIYGQEQVAETVRLCKMNLAVHGLSGDIREGNSYYENIHGSVGRFDFVMANPPFNVNRVDKDRIKDDPRYPLAMPRTDNANYLWIQIFYNSLSEVGRAGFVMANSAADARGSELEIRRRLIEAGAVDVIISVGSNFFYTVTALNDAVKWGLVARNVAALADGPRAIIDEIDPFTPEEARRLLLAIRGDRLEALYTVALAVGLRQGEALGLKWDDIDLESGTVVVRNTLDRHRGEFRLVEPKTKKSRRTLALPAIATTALKAHRAAQAEERLAVGLAWQDSWGLVFTTPFGAPLHGSNVTRRFKSILKSSGLREQRFHDLRHACASLLIVQGTHPRVIMETLGHSRISTTMDTYGHVIPELQQEAANHMDALLASG